MKTKALARLGKGRSYRLGIHPNPDVLLLCREFDILLRTWTHAHEHANNVTRIHSDIKIYLADERRLIVRRRARVNAGWPKQSLLSSIHDHIGHCPSRQNFRRINFNICECLVILSFIPSVASCTIEPDSYDQSLSAEHVYE